MDAFDTLDSHRWDRDWEDPDGIARWRVLYAKEMADGSMGYMVFFIAYPELGDTAYVGVDIYDARNHVINQTSLDGPVKEMIAIAESLEDKTRRLIDDGTLGQSEGISLVADALLGYGAESFEFSY